MTDLRETLVEKSKAVEGEFPNGIAGPDDRGALYIAVQSQPGIVKLVFPKPVDWVGFPPDQAADLCNLIMRHAKAAGLTEPITLIIP